MLGKDSRHQNLLPLGISKDHEKIYFLSGEGNREKVRYVYSKDIFSINAENPQDYFTVKQLIQQENEFYIEEDVEGINEEQKNALLNLQGINRLSFKYTPLQDLDGHYILNLGNELNAENIIKIIHMNLLPQAENIMVDPTTYPQKSILLREGEDLRISAPDKGDMVFIEAFIATENPSLSCLNDKNRIPLLTLVEAYTEIAEEQEISLKDIFSYISSNQRGYKKQIRGDKRVISVDKYGRVFLSELDVSIQSDMMIISEEGYIQQDSDKKNLYVKEAKDIQKVIPLFKNADKIEKDPQTDDIIINNTSKNQGYRLIWKLSTSSDKNSKYSIVLEKTEEVKEEPGSEKSSVTFDIEKSVSVNYFKNEIAKMIENLQKYSINKDLVSIKESDFLFQIGSYAFFPYHVNGLNAPFWIKDFDNYQNFSLFNVSSDNSSIFFSGEKNGLQSLYGYTITPNEKKYFKLKEVRDQAKTPDKLYRGKVHKEGQDLIIKGADQPRKETVDKLLKIPNTQYVVWKPELTQPVRIDLSYDCRQEEDPGFEDRVIINLSNLDEKKRSSSRFVISLKLSGATSKWSNVIINGNDIVLFILNNKIELSNKYYKISLLFDEKNFEDIFQIIFELELNSTQGKSEKNIIQFSLYEIINILKDKPDSEIQAKFIRMSEIIGKSHLIQFYRWGYRYDIQGKALWNILNPNNRKMVLPEVAQALPRKESTQEKMIIDITTTLGFQGILTVEGDKRSVVLDKIIEEISQGKKDNLYTSDLRYNQKEIINKIDPSIEVTIA